MSSSREFEISHTNSTSSSNVRGHVTSEPRQDKSETMQKSYELFSRTRDVFQHTLGQNRHSIWIRNSLIYSYSKVSVYILIRLSTRLLCLPPTSKKYLSNNVAPIIIFRKHNRTQWGKVNTQSFIMYLLGEFQKYNGLMCNIPWGRIINIINVCILLMSYGKWQTSDVHCLTVQLS